MDYNRRIQDATWFQNYNIYLVIAKEALWCVSLTDSSLGQTMATASVRGLLTTSKDRVTHDSARDENGGGATLWRHEELEDVGNEDTKAEETYKNVHAIQNEDGIEELGIDKDDRFDVLVTAQHWERVDVHFTNDVKPAGLHTDLQLGCEYEIGEKGENDCSSDSSGVRKLRKSVAFSLPETPTTQISRKKRDRELKLDDESVEKQVIISSPIYPRKRDVLKQSKTGRRIQTCTRQMTYAPVIIIGSGMSIMYVMALAFITELIGENKETSGSVISIITVIARLSSGGLVIGIQGFYPEKDIDSNEAISNYVHHVFAMVPGILTLVGFLLVLFFSLPWPKDNTEAQADEDEPPLDVHLPFFIQMHRNAHALTLGVNLSTNMVLVHSFTEDTKL
ncbi:Major facilitator super domain-containing protein 12 [Desmophyllum pertusum]|uniref:Major facilitator super domain-containing protein 12 n=1 Tax=Desmophyllum pertusum TaxID=174260 RepID=A0A9X0D138_9CNID|nr:Major facilitator super domain-containing protein 12 [Desmophyllum pertusum]